MCLSVMGRQLDMFGGRREQHGGDVARGRRKVERPISTKTAMHVTLRAERALGRWSFLRKENARFIEALITKFAPPRHCEERSDEAISPCYQRDPTGLVPFYEIASLRSQ